MALYGKGMLMTFTETSVVVEEDFNEWYNREHIDEWVWISGFHLARRYVGYDVDSLIKFCLSYTSEAVDHSFRVDLCGPRLMTKQKQIQVTYPHIIR